MAEEFFTPEEVAGKLKYVNPKGDAIREAKDMGICFGDE